MCNYYYVKFVNIPYIVQRTESQLMVLPTVWSMDDETTKQCCAALRPASHPGKVRSISWYKLTRQPAPIERKHKKI
jgi:hypothetical protein